MSDKDVNFTYSSVVAKDGKPYISVMFERDSDRAEGSLPDCRISKNKGFSDEEVGQLEGYLLEHKQEIIENAKNLTGVKNWFG